MDNFTLEELLELGIEVGHDVRIDRSVRFFGPESVSIGSNVRIDCHVVISAEDPVVIGSHVHISAGAQLFGRYGITIGDFCNISPRATIFSATDDFVGGYLIGPTVPEDFRNVSTAPVLIETHTVVGCGSVVLPGVHLGEGCSVGALSLVSESRGPGSILYGVNQLSGRKRDLEQIRDLERRFLEHTRAGNQLEEQATAPAR